MSTSNPRPFALTRRWRDSSFAAAALAAFLIDLLGGWWPRWVVLALATPLVVRLLAEVGVLLARAPRARTGEVLGRLVRVVVQVAVLQALVLPAAWRAVQDVWHRGAFVAEGAQFEDRGPGEVPRYRARWSALALEPEAPLERSFQGLRAGWYAVRLEGLRRPEEERAADGEPPARLADEDVSVVRFAWRTDAGERRGQETIAFTTRARGGRWIQRDEIVPVVALPELLTTRCPAEARRFELIWLRVAPRLAGRSFDLVLEGGP